MPELTFSAVQPVRILRNGLVAEMLDLNLLTGFNGMLEPLPVFQPCLRLHALIRPRQQQHAVDITRQTGKLIAVLVTQRMCEGRSKFGSVTGKMDIREAFKIIRDFGLRFCIRELRQPRVTRNSVSASFAAAFCGL